MQVENIVDTKVLNAKDSADLEKLKIVLQSISWTFNSNKTYECAVSGRTTVQGKYKLLEDDKILECTPESNNSTNRYIIKLLTDNDLVLTGNAENTNVILHFKPN